jgi:hypothetical protein
MRRIICRTICTAENTTESSSATSHKFHSDIEKQNRCQSKSRRRRPGPTPASFFLRSIIYHICLGE